MRRNDILVLNSGVASDKKNIASWGERRCIVNFVAPYLRKSGKAPVEYGSTEEVLMDFIKYLRQADIERP